MAYSDAEFESVRRDTDPGRQGRRATELLAVYRQRMIELARLRGVDMRRLQDQGLSYAEVAAEFGLSKGRIGQITQSAPPAERALFGVGPVTVAIPLRPSERSLPVIASEDALAYERLARLLRELQLAVEQERISIDGTWTPHGDVVAICEPKTSPVAAAALARDPVLDFRIGADGRWEIVDRLDGRCYRSLLKERGTDRDVAYVGRLPLPGGGTMLLVAGVHALGSVGAVDYLSRHAAELYEAVGDATFSLVTASRHDGDRVVASEALCPARRHG